MVGGSLHYLLKLDGCIRESLAHFGEVVLQEILV